MRRGTPSDRSRAAGFARLAGGLALPVLVLGVAGTRVGLVPEMAVTPVLAAGFALGIAALALAGYSLVDIWNSGAEGAGLAIAGIVYASPVLVLLGLVAAAAFLYPRLTDVTTDIADPPTFAASEVLHRAPDASLTAIQRDSYPKIEPHIYPLPLGDVYVAVRDVIEEKGWTVMRDIHPVIMPTAPPAGAPRQSVVEDDAVSLALSLKGVMTQSRSGMATETRAGVDSGPPALMPELAAPVSIPEFATRTSMPEPLASYAPPYEAIVEARATTLIFGFRDDVIVRLRNAPDGTQVDMRSASRFGGHDLGENARRIDGFFTALDAKLQPEPGADATGVASQ